VLFGQSSLFNGFAGREIGVTCSRAHEAQKLAVDQVRQIQIDLATYMAAQTIVTGFFAEADTWDGLLQGAGYFFLVSAKAGDNPHTGDNNTPHLVNS
jgi:hypothetical protein